MKHTDTIAKCNGEAWDSEDDSPDQEGFGLQMTRKGFLMKAGYLFGAAAIGTIAYKGSHLLGAGSDPETVALEASLDTEQRKARTALLTILANPDGYGDPLPGSDHTARRFVHDFHGSKFWSWTQQFGAQKAADLLTPREFDDLRLKVGLRGMDLLASNQEKHSSPTPLDAYNRDGLLEKMNAAMTPGSGTLHVVTLLRLGENNTSREQLSPLSWWAEAIGNLDAPQKLERAITQELTDFCKQIHILCSTQQTGNEQHPEALKEYFWGAALRHRLLVQTMTEYLSLVEPATNLSVENVFLRIKQEILAYQSAVYALHKRATEMKESDSSWEPNNNEAFQLVLRAHNALSTDTTRIASN